MGDFDNPDDSVRLNAERSNGGSLGAPPSTRTGVDSDRDPTATNDIIGTGPNSATWNRRSVDRIQVTWSVDCQTEDTFLYAAITNISEMGIFVRTTEPLPIGTDVSLRFAPPHCAEPFVLFGIVQWVNTVKPFHDNPNPGMGIRFARLSLPERERIVEAIRTIAYLREDPSVRRPTDSEN